jgi:DNA-binding transcriptional MerR regulator
MEELISIEKFIEAATKRGVDFGKGDPYNRLRYYTKIGLLPHMQRKVVGGEVVGHYPSSALDTLLEVEKLKGLGLNNQEVAKKIRGLSVNSGSAALKIAQALTPSTKMLKIALFSLFCLMIFAGFGFLPIGKSKTDLIQKTLELDKKYITDSGTAYVPRDQGKVYIKSQNVKLNSKINISFSQNYSPAVRYWVSQKIPFEGFYLELDAPTSSDAEFSWWISN